MKVKLIGSYADEGIAKGASGVCVGTQGTDKGYHKALDSGHLSILEHLPMTFEISGISRACSHQLIRYRTNKPTQESQRHVNIAQNDVVFPKTIMDNPEAYHIYLEAIQKTKEAYAALVDLKIPLEDARYITTQAETTKYKLTFNCRNFIEQCQQRLCNMAQWEIRELYRLLREEIKDVYPNVYAMCKPDCKNCKETKPCDRRK